MRQTLFSHFVSPVIVVTSILAASTRGLQASDSADYSRLLAEKSPMLVTVKFVLKIESQYGNREGEMEITGLMIDPAGLVLCGNSQLGVFRSAGSARPTDIKVLVGDDTEGLEATVMARDTELDLAWVKIKDPKDRKFTYLDLSKSAVPKTGDRLLALRRMAKFFDRAATVTDGRVAGRTTKPRELLVPGGGLTLEPGLPVFTDDGLVAGIVVVQMPDAEELESNPMAFQGIGRDIRGGLILPAAEVIKATERAKKSPSGDEDSVAEKPKADKKHPSAKDSSEAKAGAKTKSDKKKADEDEDDEPAAKKPPKKNDTKKNKSNDEDSDDE